MSADPLVRQLLDELLDSDATPELVCARHPELLPEVRSRWRRVCRLRGDLDALFPPEVADQSADDSALPQVPGYRVECVLGRGGMGVVFRAWHHRLNRPVALKMMLAGAYASPRERERFQREAEAAAGLRHPNVVQVHDVGDADGRPYFTMELVDGGSLAQTLTGTPLPVDRAAGLAGTLAAAVQVAHAAGVVHRDLKPANVLLGTYGTPKVTDFGLARRLSDEAGLTQTGVALGTPSYMAPEQAGGKADMVGPAADVYSLGAILYEMLTGRPPFRGETAAETVHQLLTHDPVPPSRLNPRVPRDLETVCLKCLRKSPSLRYAAAGELADDLGRFRRGEAISARPDGLMRRWSRRVRRRPALSAAVAFSALLLGVVVGGGLWVAAERSAEKRAKAAAEAATEQAAERDMEEMVGWLRQSSWPEARAALERAKGRVGDRGSAELKRRMDQGRRDVELGMQLDAIVLGAYDTRDGTPNYSSSQEFLAAFRGAGFGEPEDDPELVAARIRESHIRNALVVALDQWASFTGHFRMVAWMRTVAEKVDPESAVWRNRALDPANWNDKDAFGELLKTAPVASRAIPTLLAAEGRMAGRGEDTTPCLKWIQAAYPADFRVNFRLGYVLAGKGHHGEAVRYHQAALAARPGSVFGYTSLGESLRALGRNEEALEQYKHALKLAPTLTYTHVCLLTLLLQMDRHAEAEVHLQQLLKLDPKSLGDTHTIRAALIRAGRVDEVLLGWKAAINTYADHNTRYGYAEFCLFLGREDEYRRERRDLLAAYGSHPYLGPFTAERVARACLLLPASGDELRLAVALAERAAAVDRTKYAAAYPHFRFAQGLAEYRQWRLDLAIATMRGDASTVLGPAPRLVLAMALHQKNEVAEARKTLAAAVASHDWRPELVRDQDDWIYHVLRREAEAMILPNFLAGTDEPRDNTLVTPDSLGGPDAALRQGGANTTHRSDPRFDTADFADTAPGNLRADFVLPSADLTITNADVFWPRDEDPLFYLVGDFNPALPGGFPSSDHRMVYADVAAGRDRKTVTDVDFLGEDIIATGTQFMGTTVGGLSGITYDPLTGLYYSISDDRSQLNPARFYTLSIGVGDGALGAGDVTFTAVTTLLQPNGEPYPALSLDPEGIALTKSGTVFVSSEGDANAGIAPFINEYTLGGAFIRSLPVPAKYLPTATNGIVDLLAIDNNGTLLAIGRSFSTGVGNVIKLYEVRTQGATDVRGVEALAGFEADPTVNKRLLLDLADLGVTLDNIEGLTFGPQLADGRYSLIPVSDNNFSPTQFTQFLAFGLEIKTLRAALPKVETPPVLDADPDDLSKGATAGDADDPAIWVNPENASKSLVIGALKDGGLQVYDLKGKVVQTIAPKGNQSLRYNNVDVLYGYRLGRKTVDLAIASDRENDTLVVFTIDGDKNKPLKDVTGRINNNRPIFEGDSEATAYGLTAFTSPVTGKSYVFVTQAGGDRIAQFELFDGPGNNRVSAKLVRTLALPIPAGGELEDAQAEAMVVDRELGFLYVAQENVGIWKFLAEPTAPVAGTLIHPVIDDDDPDGSGLKADAEGLTIYYGPGGTGYLLASSQGDSTLAVYNRAGDNAYLGSFVGPFGGIDQTDETDGADVINVPLGPDYPFGLLVVHDGSNEPQVLAVDDTELENISTSFKFVPWERVAGALPNPLLIDTTSFDPRHPNAPLFGGVASGDTTQTSTVLWANSGYQYAGTVTFEVATDAAFRHVVARRSAVLGDRLAPVKVRVDGLQPATEYHYRAILAGGASEDGRFTTSAGVGAYNAVHFGVSGDWRGELAPFPSVSNADNKRLDFFVALGDTGYADVPSPDVPLPQTQTLADFRAKNTEVYSKRYGFNTLGDLRKSTSSMALIDDHEVTNDFTGGAPIGSDPQFTGDPQIQVGAFEIITGAVAYDKLFGPTIVELVVNGGAGNDDIEVRNAGVFRIEVVANGQSLGEFDRFAVQTIYVNGLAGHDDVSFAPFIWTDAIDLMLPMQE